MPIVPNNSFEIKTIGYPGEVININGFCYEFIRDANSNDDELLTFDVSGVEGLKTFCACDQCHEPFTPNPDAAIVPYTDREWVTDNTYTNRNITIGPPPGVTSIDLFCHIYLCGYPEPCPLLPVSSSSSSFSSSSSSGGFVCSVSSPLSGKQCIEDGAGKTVSEQHVFQECDEEYSFQVNVYFDIDTKIKLFLFRSNFSVEWDQLPYNNGFLLQNEFNSEDCGKEIFAEDEDGNSVLEGYVVGNNGQVKAYPFLGLMNRATKQEVLSTLENKYRDHNGAFSPINPAFINTNRDLLPDKFFEDNNIEPDIDIFERIYKGNKGNTPDVTSHATQTIIFCETFNIANLEVAVGEDGTDEIDIGYVPIEIHGASQQFQNVNIDDAVLGIWPQNLENIISSVVIPVNTLEFSADFVDESANKVSKYMYYPFFYSKDLAGEQIASKIKTNTFPEIYNDSGNDLNLSPDCVKENLRNLFGKNYNSEFISNNLTSSRVKLNTTVNKNDRIYVSGVFADKVYYRQVVQTHTLLSNDRPFEGENISESYSEVFNFVMQESIDGCRVTKSWRLSEVITNLPAIYRKFWRQSPGETDSQFDLNDEVPIFYGADKEGIKLIKVNPEGKASSDILLNRSEVIDQEWYDHFFGQEEQLLEEKVDEVGLLNRSVTNSPDFISGMLFDVSDEINSDIKDHDKMPYLRNFAFAITQLSEDSPGVGIFPLDYVINEITPPISLAEESSSLLGLSFDLKDAVFKPISESTSVSNDIDAISRNIEIKEFDFCQQEEWNFFMRNDPVYIDIFDTNELTGQKSDILNNKNDFYEGQNLPPGQYLISTENLDDCICEVVNNLFTQECNGMYFDYGPPLGQFDSVGNAIEDGSSFLFTHMGGKISIDIIPENANICSLCINDKILQSVLTPEKLNFNTIGQYPNYNFTVIKNFISMSEIALSIGNADTRFFVESFGGGRQHVEVNQLPKKYCNENNVCIGVNPNAPATNFYLDNQKDISQEKVNLSIGHATTQEYPDRGINLRNVLAFPDPVVHGMSYYEIDVSQQNVKPQPVAGSEKSEETFNQAIFRKINCDQ